MKEVDDKRGEQSPNTEKPLREMVDFISQTPDDWEELRSRFLAVENLPMLEDLSHDIYRLESLTQWFARMNLRIKIEKFFDGAGNDTDLNLTQTHSPRDVFKPENEREFILNPQGELIVADKKTALYSTVIKDSAIIQNTPVVIDTMTATTLRAKRQTRINSFSFNTDHAGISEGLDPAVIKERRAALREYTADVPGINSDVSYITGVFPDILSMDEQSVRNNRVKTIIEEAQAAGAVLIPVSSERKEDFQINMLREVPALLVDFQLIHSSHPDVAEFLETRDMSILFRKDAYVNDIERVAMGLKGWYRRGYTQFHERQTWPDQDVHYDEIMQRISEDLICTKPDYEALQNAFRQTALYQSGRYSTNQVMGWCSEKYLSSALHNMKNGEQGSRYEYPVMKPTQTENFLVETDRNNSMIIYETTRGRKESYVELDDVFLAHDREAGKTMAIHCEIKMLNTLPGDLEKSIGQDRLRKVERVLREVFPEVQIGHMFFAPVDVAALEVSHTLSDFVRRGDGKTMVYPLPVLKNEFAREINSL